MGEGAILRPRNGARSALLHRVAQCASRKIRSTIGGHSEPIGGWQTSGNDTEGKQPEKGAATQGGSRKKKERSDNRCPRRGLWRTRSLRVQEPDKGNRATRGTACVTEQQTECARYGFYTRTLKGMNK